MSTPFTTANATNWLSPKVLDEIITAYNQIDDVFNDGNDQIDIADYYGDRMDDVKHAVWNRLQESLELVPLCVNHIDGPLSADKTEFRYFTMSEFLSAAGLPADGLRRSKSWDGVGTPTWETGGYRQAGDIIGPWIIEDLQKVLSTLRWTVKTSSDNLCWKFFHAIYSWIRTAVLNYNDPESDEYYRYVPYRDQSFADNMAILQADYDGTSESDFHWTYDDHAITIYMNCAGSMGYWRDYATSGHPNDQLAGGALWMQNRIGKARVIDLLSLSKSADLYLALKASGDTISEWSDTLEKIPPDLVWRTSEDGTFNNLDALAMVENELTLIETFAATELTELTASNYVAGAGAVPYHIPVLPATQAGVTSNMNETYNPATTPRYQSGLMQQGVRVDFSYWLLKWNFTYQNA